MHLPLRNHAILVLLRYARGSCFAKHPFRFLGGLIGAVRPRGTTASEKSQSPNSSFHFLFRNPYMSLV